MSDPMKILITGGCGILGTAMVTCKGEKLFVDKRAKSPLLDGQDFVCGDVANYDLMRSLLEGKDALVHLAGCSDSQSADGVIADTIIHDNIIGLKTVFDAARDAGVNRVIYASSSHAVGMYEKNFQPRIYGLEHEIKLDHSVELRPDSFYGVSKGFGELYGRYLAENGGPKCYSLRIGSVRSEAEDHPYAYAEWGVRKGLWKRGSAKYVEQEERLKAIWLSRRDFVQLVERTLTYDGPPYDIFYGVSNNDRGWLDITHAREALAYEPLDNAEGWVQLMADDARGPQARKPSDLSVAAFVPVRASWEEGDRQAYEKLIRRTVECAMQTESIDRVFILTDSVDIQRQANEWGAEAPFLRPDNLSAPEVRVDMVMQYGLTRLENGGFSPDIVVPLEITYPFRPRGLLDQVIGKLLPEKFHTVIAGIAEYRPCWLQSNGTALRIDEYSKLRDNREPIYIGLPSLACATHAEMIRKGSRFGSRIGVLEVSQPEAAIEIKDVEMVRRFSMGELLK